MYLLDLFKLQIFSFGRVARLLADVVRHGVQLSNVLRMSPPTDEVAIQCDDDRITYRQLLTQSDSVAGYILNKWNVKQGTTVLLICENNMESIVVLLALSALGCNVKLIGSNNAALKLPQNISKQKIDLCIASTHDEHFYAPNLNVQWIVPKWKEAQAHRAQKKFVYARTRISVFTSGSTGVPKKAERSNTLLQYLKAIADLYSTLGLRDYHTVYQPVPIYHSYGLSALFLSLMFRKKIILSGKFEAAKAAREISLNAAEVAIVVPQMIHRLAEESVTGLRCIISSGDALPVHVFTNARAKFGDIIFNLYGTSETGLCTIAEPARLLNSPGTIGRPIAGCEVRLVQENGNTILQAKSGFGIRHGFISTGDVATRDQHGNYFIHGRLDDLIVINGVNVYPREIQDMAYTHPEIQHVTVKTILNEEGFKRIKLIMVTKSVTLNEQTFKDWWRNRFGTQFLPSVVELRDDDRHIKLMHG